MKADWNSKQTWVDTRAIVPRDESAAAATESIINMTDGFAASMHFRQGWVDGYKRGQEDAAAANSRRGTHCPEKTNLASLNTTSILDSVARGTSGALRSNLGHMRQNDDKHVRFDVPVVDLGTVAL